MVAKNYKGRIKENEGTGMKNCLLFSTPKKTVGLESAGIQQR